MFNENVKEEPVFGKSFKHRVEQKLKKNLFYDHEEKLFMRTKLWHKLDKCMKKSIRKRS